MTRHHNDGARFAHRGPRRHFLIERAVEVIEWMMDNDGYTELTKREAVEVLARRYGSVWKTVGGEANRKLLVDVVALMHDQHDSDEVAERLGGYMIRYSPNIGGLTLVGALGEMDVRHLAMTLLGDLEMQQRALTAIRRRTSGWKTLSEKAFIDGKVDLARCCAQIEREIDTRGYVPGDLVDDYRVIMSGLPPATP